MVDPNALVDARALFSRALADNPLHFAAHSHHLWPDASWLGQRQAWEDAARLADAKWDKVLGEVLPEAQGHVARELNLPDPATVVFAPNTHELLVRLVSALEQWPVRLLASEGEFHSFRRQAARWLEAGLARVTLARDPLTAEPQGRDLLWVSHVQFGTGRVLADLDAYAATARVERPWVAIDGYHGFMAVETDLAQVADRLFYVAGGYKYAMAGEGVAFMHCPPGYAARPVNTGWFAEFDELSGVPGRVGYATDARRMMGATFDPSGLYRLNAVRRMLGEEGFSTGLVSRHVAALQARLLDGLAGTPLAGAELLNPLANGPHARFLAFRSSHAAAIHGALAAKGVTTDVRGDVLRVGFGLYHVPADVDALIAILKDVL